MKQSVINVVVGFLFFTVMFLLYNLLFQDDMGVKEILLMSFWISLGNEFVVPRFIKWSQTKGWFSKR
ncbi:MAG: hypothetical protein HOM43_07905 [Flavobacteriales bacterium]|jgi:hypothetical protein|nr:hypothetical protein [Flavobacteriales bacterium]